MLIEGDIETRKSLERTLLASSATDAKRIFRLLRSLRRRIKDGNALAARDTS